jgi:hypothetical protein
MPAALSIRPGTITDIPFLAKINIDRVPALPNFSRRVF